MTGSTPPNERRPGGRPRSEAARAAILDAALALVIARGYEGASVEAVAAAAGASKATIYRWWPSKADLAVDAFFHATREALALPDTGSAREDFRLQVLELADVLAGERGRALAAMLGGARGDPALARALGARWLAPRRRWGVERMARAAAAGELRDGVEVGAALGVLYAPLYAPLLFGGTVPSHPEAEAHLRVALAGVFR